MGDLSVTALQEVGTRLLAGRRILISGGTSGLGAALVRAAIAAGASVGVLGRRAALLDALSAETGAEGEACDITNRAAVERSVAAVAERLGGLDGLVNCAGQMLHSRITAGFREDWEGMLNVNVLGTLNTTVAAWPLLRQAPYADVMFISSRSADRVAGADFAMYGATKAALLRVADGLAAEVAEENLPIRITTIKPGYIDTEGVVSHIRDAAARALITANAKQIGLPPEPYAEEIVHLLSLPRSLRVAEMTIERAAGYRPEV
jgi:NADP-dependent 3-hydroxy acid dehydrogenase YdfG